MSISAVPHINFNGQARKALEFSQSVFGGGLSLTTYQDFGSSQEGSEKEQIMFGQLTADSGFTMMAFDALPSRLSFDRGQNSFYIAAQFSSADETKESWARLSEGAHVRQQLGPAPWAPTLYGMLEDRFGVIWIIAEQRS